MIFVFILFIYPVLINLVLSAALQVTLSLIYFLFFFSAVICKARRVFHLAGSVASLCLSSVLTDGGENTQVLLITWLKCPQALMPTRCCFVSSLGPKAWVASVNRIAVHKRITNVCCCCFFFTFPKVGCVHWIFIFFPHSLLLQLPLKLTTFYFILGVLKL